MKEINKRILTSLLLTILFIIAMSSNVFLTIALFFIFCQVFYEFKLIFDKILKKKILFFILFFLLIYLSILIVITWQILSLNEFLDKIKLLTIITVCISSDIGGYIFGKTFQGKKITKISPNKTYSGMIKRKAKIKDSGNILPGHGGLLDRFDGFIFAIPICFLLEGFL